MTEEYIEEKDTLDTSPQEDNEETELDEQEDDESDVQEDDTSKTKADDDNDEDVDWKSEAEKWKKTASTYKQEIETKGLRRKELNDNKEDKKPDTYKTDYLSKREDILDEYSSQFDELDEKSFTKLKRILNPALESVYQDASKENRFVARGELKRTVSDLIDMAKGSTTRADEIEKARLEGISDRDKMNDAEVSGKSKSKPSEGYTNEVRQLAKEKNWNLDVAKQIYENRKRREKEYSVRHFI